MALFGAAWQHPHSRLSHRPDYSAHGCSQVGRAFGANSLPGARDSETQLRETRKTTMMQVCEYMAKASLFGSVTCVSHFCWDDY